MRFGVSDNILCSGWTLLHDQGSERNSQMYSVHHKPHKYPHKNNFVAVPNTASTHIPTRNHLNRQSGDNYKKYHHHERQSHHTSNKPDHSAGKNHFRSQKHIHSEMGEKKVLNKSSEQVYKPPESPQAIQNQADLTNTRHTKLREATSMADVYFLGKTLKSYHFQSFITLSFIGMNVF